MMGETKRKKSNYEVHANDGSGANFERDDIIAHGRFAKNHTVPLEELYFGKEQDR